MNIKLVQKTAEKITKVAVEVILMVGPTVIDYLNNKKKERKKERLIRQKRLYKTQAVHCVIH